MSDNPNGVNPNQHWVEKVKELQAQVSTLTAQNMKLKIALGKIAHMKGAYEDWPKARLCSDIAEEALSFPLPLNPWVEAVTKKERGLFQKYIVQHIDGKPVNWCFVLQDTDPLAIPALTAYAKSAREAGYEKLADDLESTLRGLVK